MTLPNVQPNRTMTDLHLPFDDPDHGREAVDEALSALLDGEFDAWAEDHGIEPAVARAALEARPEYASRHEALASVHRRFSQEPPSALDDFTRARLVREAMARATSSSRRTNTGRRWAVAATVAAVFIAATFAVVVRQRGSDTTHVASSASRSTTAPLDSTYRGNFGDISNPDALRARLAAPGPAADAAKSIAGSASTTVAPVTTTSSGAEPSPTTEHAVPGTPTQQPSSAGSAVENSVPPVPIETVRRCARIQAARSRDGRVGLTASGTYQGAPAAVVVVTTPTRSTAYVLAASSCAVLASQSSKIG